MIIIIAVILLILITLIIRWNKQSEGFSNENAIVCLTRGYDTTDKYDKLISRNNSIYEIIKTENYDVILFHEGNITIQHQEYIQKNTPMKLIFTEIPFYNNTQVNEICMPTELSNSLGIGYKNMCYFWSIDFLEYLKKYEYIIRIDEDCVLKKFNNNTLNDYRIKNIKFSSPYFQGPDEPDVTVGMETIFHEYINSNELKCPYTNFMIVNIPYFRSNKKVNDILNKIKETNCIFSNRWGDLPIWGYILTYMIDKKYYIEDKNISYMHDSHGKMVN